MTKEEYLSMSLPYGLKFKTKLGNVFEVGYSKGEIVRPISTFIKDKGKPICRPLSDLTKEIVQADYNDGEPFIPLEELFSDRVFLAGSFVFFKYTDGLMSVFYTYKRKERTISEFLPFSSIQMLLKWHFAIGLKEDEFIPVTEEFNPYK